MGKLNYENKVQKEFSNAVQEKNRLIDLEKRENFMLERLKVYIIYNTSSQISFAKIQIIN